MSPLSKLDAMADARDFRRKHHRLATDKDPVARVRDDVLALSYLAQRPSETTRVTFLDVLPEAGEEWIDHMVHVRGAAGAPDRLFLCIQLLDDSVTWIELSLLVAPNQGSETVASSAWTWLRNFSTNDPYALTANPASSEVFVTSPTGVGGNPKIRKFSPSGTLLVEVGTASTTGAATACGTALGPGGPLGITYDGVNNNLLVGRNGSGSSKGPNYAVWYAAATGGCPPMTTSTLSAFPSPIGGGSAVGQIEENAEQITSGLGCFWVADTNNNRIGRIEFYGLYGGTPAPSAHGSLGSADGQMNGPRGVAVHGLGYVFVADTGNNRIQKFRVSGSGTGTVLSFVTKWGTVGTGPGQFASGGLRHLFIDDSRMGNLHVVDGGNHRVQVFDIDGNYIGEYGSFGSGNGQLSSPVGIVIAINGTISVADRGNNRIACWVKS